jgi:hypothetical protein
MPGMDLLSIYPKTTVVGGRILLYDALALDPIKGHHGRKQALSRWWGAETNWKTNCLHMIQHSKKKGSAYHMRIPPILEVLLGRPEICAPSKALPAKYLQVPTTSSRSPRYFHLKRKTRRHE